METHYIFVDLENVALDCRLLPVEKNLKVLVFVGAKQKGVPIETVMALQPLGPLVEYIKISDAGRNALDFHIAYYIGKISQKDPSAILRIVSNDKGFDPLIRHLQSNGFDVVRFGVDLEKKVTNPTDRQQDELPVEAALAFLHRVEKSRPRRVASLKNALKSSVDRQMSDSVLDALVNQLSAMGYINVSGTSINYHLPGGARFTT